MHNRVNVEEVVQIGRCVWGKKKLKEGGTPSVATGLLLLQKPHLKLNKGHPSTVQFFTQSRVPQQQNTAKLELVVLLLHFRRCLLVTLLLT